MLDKILDTNGGLMSARCCLKGGRGGLFKGDEVEMYRDQGYS